ncbi:MAG: pirin family protein [Candidatus Nanopelagicales bacterium]
MSAPSPDPLALGPREVPLGGPRGMLVRRTLPHRDVRTVGPWCFCDHFGPLGSVEWSAAGPGPEPVMKVPPHPHTGLQTVTWLLEGEVDHRDTVGSVQRVRPRELNLMTAGAGIAHSEYSVDPGTLDPDGSPGRLFGVQLWVALPDSSRHTDPHFEHHADLPRLTLGAFEATVVMGEVDSVRSPARTYSPMLAVEVRLPAGAAGRLPLDPAYEHAVLAADGSVRVDDVEVGFGALLVLDPGRREVSLASARGATLLLFGGEPLGEELLMWWNFVGRSHDEIVTFRDDWHAGRFGTVVGDPEPPLPAPELPRTVLRARPGRR